MQRERNFSCCVVINKKGEVLFCADDFERAHQWFLGSQECIHGEDGYQIEFIDVNATQGDFVLKRARKPKAPMTALASDRADKLGLTFSIDKADRGDPKKLLRMNRRIASGGRIEFKKGKRG